VEILVVGRGVLVVVVDVNVDVEVHVVVVRDVIVDVASSQEKSFERSMTRPTASSATTSTQVVSCSLRLSGSKMSIVSSIPGRRQEHVCEHSVGVPPGAKLERNPLPPVLEQRWRDTATDTRTHTHTHTHTHAHIHTRTRAQIYTPGLVHKMVPQH
jgi:hypothetical protein